MEITQAFSFQKRSWAGHEYSMKNMKISLQSTAEEEDIYAQGEALLAMAEKECSHVQVRITNPVALQLELVKGKPHSFISANDLSYAILVHLDGKAGISGGNAFSPDIVHRAVAVAKAAVHGDYFYGLPEKQPAKRVALFDKKIAQISEVQLLDMGEELASGITEQHTILSTGSLSKETSTDYLFTSEGVQHVEQQTSLSAVAECIARQGEKVSSAWDYKQERQWFPLSPFAAAIGRKTNAFLHANQLQEKPPVVIIKPEPFAELLDHAFLSNLDVKRVEKGKSLFADKVDKQVLSSTVTITDDAQLPYGQHSHTIDFEGTPGQKTPLFQHGVLKNFIYDYNTALHAGKTPTGNADFSAIDFTNVVVEGEFQEVDHALIVDSVIGAHTAEEVSTDFSVTVDRAYLLKNGQKVPVTGFMLSGKVLHALQNTVSIGKKIEARNGIYTGALATTGINVII